MVEARGVPSLVREAVRGGAGPRLRRRRERDAAVRVVDALALAVRQRDELRAEVRVAEAGPALRDVERVARAREPAGCVPAELRAAARAIHDRGEPARAVVAEREEHGARGRAGALVDRRDAQRAGDGGRAQPDARVRIARPVARGEQSAGAVLVDEPALRLHARGVELHPPGAGDRGARRERRHREARARFVHEGRAVVARVEAPAPGARRGVVDGAERLAPEPRVEHEVGARDEELAAGDVHDAARHGDEVGLAPLGEAHHRRESRIRRRAAEQQLREREQRGERAPRGERMRGGHRGLRRGTAGRPAAVHAACRARSTPSNRDEPRPPRAPARPTRATRLHRAWSASHDRRAIRRSRRASVRVARGVGAGGGEVKRSERAGLPPSEP